MINVLEFSTTPSGVNTSGWTPNLVIFFAASRSSAHCELQRTARALRSSQAQDPGDAEVSPSPRASILLLEFGVRYIWHTTQHNNASLKMQVTFDSN